MQGVLDLGFEDTGNNPVQNVHIGVLRLENVQYDAQKRQVLHGQANGLQARKDLCLDEFDRQIGKVMVVIPDEIRAVTMSYFWGLFYDSIYRLGERAFREKYEFRTNNPAISMHIEDGIWFCLRVREKMQR